MKPFKHFILECVDLLMEDRIQFLKDKNPTIDTSHDTNATHREAGDIIDHFANRADPSKKKVHTQWILNQYKRGSIRQEDHPRISAALTGFDKYKSKLEKKDINQYGSIGEIEDAVHPHLGTAATKKEASSVRDTEGHKLVHTHTDQEGNKYDVYHLSDKKISQDVYGGGHKLGYPHTSWCTAARSEDCMFDDYHKDGNLYTIHKTDKDGNKSVFQLHPKSDQFMDSMDNSVQPHQMPPKEVFDFQDEHMHKFRILGGFGKKEDYDKALSYNNPTVHRAIAEEGKKEHLDKLVNSMSPSVRALVASHGHKEHLDKLVNDDHTNVRLEVAKHGHKEHLDKLVNDDHIPILDYVKEHGYPEHLEILKNNARYQMSKAKSWGMRGF